MNIDWSQAVPILANVLLVLCTVGGLLGSFFPAFPGAVLIWGGALLHGLITAWDPLGLYAQMSLAALMALSAGSQFAISAMGAKRFGSTGWGVLGAGIGMLIGTFAIPIPIVGSLMGAFLGALTFELGIAQRLTAKRAAAESAKVEAHAEIDAVARPVEKNATAGAAKKAGKEVGQAARAGVGAAVGAVLGMMAEIGIAFVMVGVLAWSVIF
jgi:hypothetical protein